MKRTVGELKNIQPHFYEPRFLRTAEIDGHKLVVGNHYEEGQLGFFIPPGAILPEKLLKEMWLWNEEHQKGRLAGKKGNRCKVRDYDGTLSEGLFYGAWYFYDGERVESPSWDSAWKIGDDVSEALGITFKEE